MGYDELSADVRDRVDAGVREVIARGHSGPQLVDELVEQFTEVSGDVQLVDWLFAMSSHLQSLPETERKALMFDIVMQLGLIAPD